jgi:hypothetical protein
VLTAVNLSLPHTISILLTRTKVYCYIHHFCVFHWWSVSFWWKAKLSFLELISSSAGLSKVRLKKFCSIR